MFLIDNCFLELKYGYQFVFKLKTIKCYKKVFYYLSIYISF